jgi:bifunctional non-homologous end joining protein LigD
MRSNGDGYRICVVINARRAKVRTRRGHDWSDKFKPISVAAAALPCYNAVIDGEAVVLDAQGRASFSALQADVAGGGKGAVWVRPELRAETAYRAFTTAGELRHE